jgi:hypothetical protein
MSHAPADEPEKLTEETVENLDARFAELGLNPTNGIAILPSNFLYATGQSDLYLVPAAPDMKVRLRQAGVALDKVTPEGVTIRYRDDRDSTLTLPLLFLGGAFLSQNANLINVALGVAANYVTDYFRGKAGRHRVVCSFLVETTEATTQTKTNTKAKPVTTTEKKTAKKLDFDGPAESFNKLIDTIKKALE